MGQPNIPDRPVQEQVQYQQPVAQYAGLDEQQIRRIVKDEMIDFVTNHFTQNLSEQIKKTMLKQMIAEGKIKVKPRAKKS
jgi:hypothetical protein